MGRRPNPLILSYFERGPKLNDNSNRYPHRCKACGEDFPKGRLDSLTSHLTKKCPAIPENERIEACASLQAHTGAASGRGQKSQEPQPPPLQQEQQQQPLPLPNPIGFNGVSHVTNGIPMNQHPWSALETLAEVSRRMDLSEKHDDHTHYESTSTHFPDGMLVSSGTNPFELHEQFTVDNPPLSYEDRPHRERQDSEQNHGLTTEEKLRSLLRTEEDSDLSVAAAAAVAASARLNSSILDQQLQMGQLQMLPEEPPPDAAEAPHRPQEMVLEYSAPERVPTPDIHTSAAQPPLATQEPASSFGEITYIPGGLQAPATVSDQSQQLALTLNKGGFRMDTSGIHGARGRHHTRARFDSNRRKEVQEVRRIGACIRCRILRKTCSKGTPCDTCRKVLSPRVWRTGCTRTKLAELIELYSAGVQIVVAQKRVNQLKTDYRLSNNGAMIEASFDETGHKLELEVLQGCPTESEHDGCDNAVIMIDNDKEDIPAKVENYMRHVLSELIGREPSNHVRTTLQYSLAVAHESKDELLKRSLDLWGIVEMMHRERNWSFTNTSANCESKSVVIKDDNETFTNLSMQLTAAAERKAASISKSLLNGIQRALQDGKTKLGFPMLLTAMVFVNCVEKTTWTFKAWEGEQLRAMWPLEKQPKDYYNQGYGLTELLRMLLHIRHILPKLSAPDPDRPITAEHDNEAVRKYYEELNVTSEAPHRTTF